jgi:hypothetical protein
MSNRTFGRARVEEAAVPESSLGWDDSWSIEPENRERWIVLLLCSPLLILLIDGLFSGTELISPIGSPYLWWMRGLGLADGIVLLFFMRNSPMFEQRGMVRKVLLILVGPLLMAAAFDALAWRSADWIAFGMSSAPYESAQYPIKQLNMARKGRRATIAIDPLGTGEDAHIPIPRDQYRQLIAADGDQCVTVQRRRAANGAVQIRTNGNFTLNEPDYAPVTSC